MYDLKDLIPDDSPIVVELKHPESGDALGMTITVASRHSAEYERYMYAKVQERVDAGDTGDKEFTLKELQDETRALYANLVLSWDIILDGKTPRVTPKKAEEVFKKLKWVVPQIEDAIAAKESFTQA